MLGRRLGDGASLSVLELNIEKKVVEEPKKKGKEKEEGKPEGKAEKQEAKPEKKKEKKPKAEKKAAKADKGDGKKKKKAAPRSRFFLKTCDRTRSAIIPVILPGFLLLSKTLLKSAELLTSNLQMFTIDKLYGY